MALLKTSNKKNQIHSDLKGKGMKIHPLTDYYKSVFSVLSISILRSINSRTVGQLIMQAHSCIQIGSALHNVLTERSLINKLLSLKVGIKTQTEQSLFQS